MRKITNDAVNAFYSNGLFSRDNTHVYINLDGENCLKLHDTVIAKIQRDGILWLNTDGWRTNTTKERLNGLLDGLGLKIYQRKGKWYVMNLSNEESVNFFDGMEIVL